MTDRINFLTVSIEDGMTAQDCQDIVKAVSMIKGVLGVGLNVETPGYWDAREKERIELRRKLDELTKI